MKLRAAADNVKRLLYGIKAIDNIPDDCFVLSLDGHKAFDRVHRSYLWLIMERFRFGFNFIQQSFSPCARFSFPGGAGRFPGGATIRE